MNLIQHFVNGNLSKGDSNRRGKVFNPATGEHIQYVLTGRETAGSVVRFRWIDEPGGSIVSHTHPGCSETFTILDGEAVLIVDGKEVLLQAGETAVVPPGCKVTMDKYFNVVIKIKY